MINHAAIVEQAQKYIPVAEREAQEALAKGDMRRWETRSADADWYRVLVETHSGYGEDAA